MNKLKKRVKVLEDELYGTRDVFDEATVISPPKNSTKLSRTDLTTLALSLERQVGNLKRDIQFLSSRLGFTRQNDSYAANSYLIDSQYGSVMTKFNALLGYLKLYIKLPLNKRLEVLKIKEIKANVKSKTRK